MKRSRFTEEQIIAVLREQEAGVPTAEVCRKHGVSSATFYKWSAPRRTAERDAVPVSAACSRRTPGLAARLQRSAATLQARLDDACGFSGGHHRRSRLGRCAAPGLRAPASCQPPNRGLQSTPDSRFAWMKNGVTSQPARRRDDACGDRPQLQRERLDDLKTD